MDKTTIMAYFSIHGDTFELEEVTRCLGIEPTDIKIKGTVPDGRKRPSIETSWKISTDEEESLDINVQLDKIICLLSDKKDILRSIKTSMDVDFDFVFVVKIENGEKPSMHFNSKHLGVISYIGAEIDIDLYIYS